MLSPNKQYDQEGFGTSLFPYLFCCPDHLMNRAPMKNANTFWLDYWVYRLVQKIVPAPTIETLQRVVRKDFLTPMSASRVVAIHADPAPKIHMVYVQMGLVGDK